MPESMYWMKPVSWLPRGTRLRDWVRADGPSRLWTPWARSRRPSKSSTKSNWRPRQRQGDLRQVLGWHTSSFTHTHTNIVEPTKACHKRDYCLCDSLGEIRAREKVCCLLFTGVNVCKRETHCWWGKGPELKAKTDQLLLLYSSFSLLITKHKKLNVDCVYIPLIQLLKKKSI